MAFEDDDDVGELDDQVEGGEAEEDEPTEEELDAAAVPDELEEKRRAGRRAEKAPQQQQQTQYTPEQLQAFRAQQQADNLTKALRRQRDDGRRMRAELAQKAQADVVRQQRFEKLVSRIAEQSGVDVSDILRDPNAPEPLPSEEENPVGHLKGAMKELLTPLQQKLERLEAEAQEQKITDGIQRVESYHASDIAAFQAEAPDYMAAEEYVIQAVESQTWHHARQQHPEWDDDEVAQAVEGSLQRVAADLQVRYAYGGKSLAREIYRQALEMGWRPDGGGQQPPARKSNGKVSALRKNLRDGVVTGGARPTGRGGGLSLNALLDPEATSDEDFDELTSRPGAWKKLVESMGS